MTGRRANGGAPAAARNLLTATLIATLLATLLAATVATASAPGSGRSAGDPLIGTHDVVVDGRTPPKIYAKSWVVVDADTGDVLAARNAHMSLPPASTLKTLTAVTLLPRLDLDDQYRVQWEDAHVEGSAVGIVPGSRYTIDNLFYGLMLPSGNDAARALASANGGSATTVRQMNGVAHSLGAMDTHAVNASGLDARNQVTSSFDLALFARAGLSDKDFRRYVSTTSVSFPAQEPKGDKKRASYMIYNQNPLLVHGYRGILGVKTGYTTLAGRTYVGAAERGGQRLIVALMGIVEASETAATKLLEWGWNHGESVTPVGSLDAPHEPLVDDTQPSSHASPSTSADDEGGAGSAAESPSPVAADADDPLAGDSQAAGTGPALVLWILAGALLIGVGWWLRVRRRPSVQPPAGSMSGQRPE